MQLCITTFALSLIGFYFITHHTTNANFEETRERAKEHRIEESAASQSGGVAGWRRKRNVIEMTPRLDEKTAKSFGTKVK